jgi:hypothetical protein
MSGTINPSGDTLPDFVLPGETKPDILLPPEPRRPLPTPEEVARILGEGPFPVRISPETMDAIRAAHDAMGRSPAPAPAPEAPGGVRPPEAEGGLRITWESGGARSTWGTINEGIAVAVLADGILRDVTGGDGVLGPLLKDTVIGDGFTILYDGSPATSSFIGWVDEHVGHTGGAIVAIGLFKVQLVELGLRTTVDVFCVVGDGIAAIFDWAFGSDDDWNWADAGGAVVLGLGMGLAGPAPPDVW